jgi:hypothetical protein
MMDWVKVIEIAVAAVGWLEWAKHPFPDVPSLVWWAALPVACVGFAAVAYLFPGWVMVGAAGLSIASLAYDNIIKLIKAKIETTG